MTGKRVLDIVLAGGPGKRLAPLTAHRPQSAVPFGGMYRLVDFALSNLVNAGIRRICVLTQYKSLSLDRHLVAAWRLSSLLDDYVMAVPAQMISQHAAWGAGGHGRGVPGGTNGSSQLWRGAHHARRLPHRGVLGKAR